MDAAQTSAGPIAFPARSVLLGIAAMVLIAVASVATAWLVGNRIRSIGSSQVEVLNAAPQLQRQRELLELYATLAITTGDGSWAFRYGRVQPQLRRTLAALREEMDLPENRAAILGVEQAEREISAMEFHALALAVAGEPEAARAVFERRRYRQFADAYRSGLAEVQRRTRDYVAGAQAETNFFLRLNLASSLVALLLIGLAWLLLLRPMRAWARQLEDARRRAERATAAKSDFLAVMSHEMRTPLNSIIGFADLALKHPQVTGELRRHVELMQTSGRMLLTVINDLLDFSKIEAGAVELSDEPFALAALVENSVSIIAPSASEKGLDLRLTLDPGLSPFYRGDEGRLRQILLNLLNNAVKFTERGGVSLSVARIAAAQGGDRLRFEVVDTGPGIEPERQGRLFEPFVQADPSITRAYGGTGLGLSIARRLVEAMGGSIGVVSTPGEGSTFWFEVTLAQADPPAQAAEAPEPDPGSAASILLAEDMDINRKLAMAMLAEAGHRVDVVEDGAQAVEAARSARYDVILMDLQMPRMDGLTAARRIRALPPPACDVAIVAMTANALPADIEEVRQAGFDGHLAKPMTKRDVEAAIGAALRRPARREPAPFDEAAFGRLAAAMPLEALRDHASELDAEARAVAGSDPAELPARAHRIVAGAAWLGLPSLSQRAAELERAAREESGLEAALEAFGSAAGDAAAFVLPRLEHEEAEE